VTVNAEKKRADVSLVIGKDNLESIQKFYGGTPHDALVKFIETQLCKQCTVEKVIVEGDNDGQQ
jgi:nicotinic acid mononucleotide adenylyltransferase